MIEVTKLERKVYDGILVSLSPPDVTYLMAVLGAFFDCRPWYSRPDVELNSWANDLYKQLKENRE